MATDLTETIHPVDSAALLELLGHSPRVLALGEPTHGAPTLLSLRNALFRQLVEHEGYRTIALESDCVMGLLVDAYVTRTDMGTDDELSLDDALADGLSHEWGQFPANRELVQWMRTFNDGRAPSDQVRFAGIDGPLEITGAASPRQPLVALHTYLASRVDPNLLPCTADVLDRLLDADDRWTNPDAMLDPAASIGQTAQARELRLIADDLVALLDAQAPGPGTPTDRDLARLYGRTATGLLRYHFWMADTTPGRMTWLLSVRDSMMAANLLALAERGPTLVSAHNSHLQRTRSTMRMWDHPQLQWWGAGALADGRLGADYAFLATAVGTIEHEGVTAPPSDTLEGMMYALPGEQHLLDARRLATHLDDTGTAARVSPWYGYAPLDPMSVARADGIVFVKDVRRP